MKKWLSLALALSLALSLTACGGSSNSETPSGSDNTAAESSDSIKIGLYTPLTGSSALVGTQEQNGVNLAAK